MNNLYNSPDGLSITTARPVRRNTPTTFIDVPVMPLEMIVWEVGTHEKNGSRWVAPPAPPISRRHKPHAIVERHVPTARFASPLAERAFCNAVPTVFSGWEAAR